MKCWWCREDEKKPAEWLIDTVPICKAHTLQAIDYCLSESGGADIRPLGWKPRPQPFQGPPLF